MFQDKVGNDIPINNNSIESFALEFINTFPTNLLPFLT
jgi:hypothetical protein